jgi:hypothetical protein
MSNLDIYHTAKVLVKHHGKDAPALAAIRADEPLSAGDLDGYAILFIDCHGRQYGSPEHSSQEIL